MAWVTRSGKTELAEPIAVRPTSETGEHGLGAGEAHGHVGDRPRGGLSFRAVTCMILVDSVMKHIKMHAN